MWRMTSRIRMLRTISIALCIAAYWVVDGTGEVSGTLLPTAAR